MDDLLECPLHSFYLISTTCCFNIYITKFMYKGDNTFVFERVYTWQSEATGQFNIHAIHVD